MKLTKEDLTKYYIFSGKKNLYRLFWEAEETIFELKDKKVTDVTFGFGSDDPESKYYRPINPVLLISTEEYLYSIHPIRYIRDTEFNYESDPNGDEELIHAKVSTTSSTNMEYLRDSTIRSVNVKYGDDDDLNLKLETYDDKVITFTFYISYGMWNKLILGAKRHKLSNEK